MRSHLICERNLWVRKQTTPPVYALGVSLMLASLGNITRSWKGAVLSLMWLLNRNRRSSYMRCPCSRLSCGSCTHLLVSNTFTLCLHLGRGTAGDTLIWHSLYHPLAQAGIGDSLLCWGSWGEDGDYFRLNNWGTAAETESLRAARIIRLTVHLPPTSVPDFSLPSPKSSGQGTLESRRPPDRKCHLVLWDFALVYISMYL